MSSGGANIEFYGKMEALVKDMDRLAKKQQETIDKFDKIGKTARKGGTDAEKATAAAAREMDKFAAATMKLNQHPLERYKEEMFKLNTALKAGKIDQESYSRAVDKARASITATTTQVQQAGQATKQSFGASAASSVLNYAAGFMSVTAAVGAFSAALSQSRAETEAALQAVEKLIETRSQLQQVAEGPGGADVQQMNEFADKLSQRGISRAEAQAIIFSARSEGFAGQEDMVARLIGANQFKAADIRTLAGQVPTIFGGAVSPMEGIAGGAYGAKVSRLNVTEFAAMLPKGAQAGTILGGAPAETIALTSVLAGRSERSMEYAATLAGQLAFGKRGKEFEGLGVVGAVEKLSQMPEEQQRELLGTGKEANLIYQWTLADMPRIKEVRKQAQAAMDNVNSYVSDVEGMVFDPNTQQGRLMISRRESIVARNEAEIGGERRLAEGGYLRQAAMTREKERLAERGEGPLAKWGAGKAMEYADASRVSPGMVGVAGEVGSAVVQGAMEPVIRLLFGAAEKLDDSAANLESATSDTARQRAAAAVQPE